MLAVSLLFAVLLGAIAFQGWQIVDAIMQAERSSVVAWPTREPAVAHAPVATSTPAEQTTQPTASNPTPTREAGVAAASSDGASVAVDPIRTPLPTSTSVSHAPTPTVETTSTPPLAQGPGDTSHLSVVRDIFGAGIEGGDPARANVWGGRASLNILVIGVDRRADGGDQNADVLIIARVDMVNRKVAAVSLPRDLLVEIPGIGPDKINGAYNYGVLANPSNQAAGVAKVRDTIESVFGVTLDGYVLIDFDGFEQVVDSVGGVNLVVPYQIVDEHYPTEDYGTEVLRFEPGFQHMDGDRALRYVRTRHGDNDDARRDRQLQVLLALFDTGKRISSVTRADEIIIALSRSVQTSFPLDQQLTLARVGMDIERVDIRLSVLGPPLLEPGYTADGKWVYLGDLTTIVAFVQDALLTDPVHMTANNDSGDATGS